MDHTIKVVITWHLLLIAADIDSSDSSLEWSDSSDSSSLEWYVMSASVRPAWSAVRLRVIRKTVVKVVNDWSEGGRGCLKAEEALWGSVVLVVLTLSGVWGWLAASRQRVAAAVALTGTCRLVEVRWLARSLTAAWDSSSDCPQGGNCGPAGFKCCKPRWQAALAGIRPGAARRQHNLTTTEPPKASSAFRQPLPPSDVPLLSRPDRLYHYRGFHGKQC